MASRFELFTQFSIFKGLKVEDLFSILTKVGLDFENYHSGDLILERGSESKGLIFLLDGMVNFQKDESAKKVQVEGPSLLVYTHIYGDNPRAKAEISAVSDCGIMNIDAHSMLHLLRSNEIVLKNYLDLIANEIK